MPARKTGGRFGWVGYVDLLVDLKRPRTIHELLDEGWEKSTLYRVLPQLRERGIVHIQSWKTHRTKAAPVYAYGVGEDAIGPREPVRATAYSSELRAFCNALDVLNLPASAQMIREATGAARETVVKLLTAMKAAKLIHIAEWRPRGPGTGGEWTAFYTYGNFPNAVKPSPLEMRRTNCRRYRAKKRGVSRMGLMVASLAANDSQREAA